MKILKKKDELVVGISLSNAQFRSEVFQTIFQRGKYQRGP